MFNNSRIGHNKFAVYFDKDGAATTVLTGSTNWTPTGLCGQSNNAMLIQNSDIAEEYAEYWELLSKDTKRFTKPHPLTESTHNAQGHDLRSANAKPGSPVVLGDQRTRLSVWRAPNTLATTKGKQIPPDLSAVYSLMRKAQNAILFVVFLPSRAGKQSIVEEAIRLGQNDRSLLVYGSVSDPQAMPNYVAPSKDEGEGDDHPRAPSPSVFDTENVHVVRATAITEHDAIGHFEHELLKVGNAIIHDKIVVIDPLSDGCVVVMGSHNLGYKASYENDENLVILSGNQPLAQAYAVHLLDLYDHYRFRAVQAQRQEQGQSRWSGFLSRNDDWLRPYLTGEKNALARYFAR
jgi:phosphatidylserine/phosphatidylglycerophosphate/cardiolipin synthase-like enzyme